MALPAGADATDEIVMTWCDARNGLNNEQALVQYSVDQGVSWSAPVNGAEAGDRPNFPAISISPEGEMFTWYMTPSLIPGARIPVTPRRMQGVVRHANADLTGWSTLNRAAIGDARGSSANGLTSEFLGDYNYAVATRDYGAAVWNDVRDAAVCPAINAFRQSLVDGSPIARPAPNTDCPATFGNSDIFGGSYADPTP